jgi:hypothetical protein
MRGYTMFIAITILRRYTMERTFMEPEREARLKKALRLLANPAYLDKLVCERFNAAITRNIDFV